MSVRIKIGMILCAALLGLAAAQFGIQQFILLPGFYSLERDEATKDAERVLNAIQNEINHLNTFTRDWAAWDDTYAFVENRNQDYVDSNLVDDTFFANGLNLIYVCDLDGRRVWGKIIDLVTQKEITLDLFSKEGLPAGHPLRIAGSSPADPRKEINGLLQTETGPLVISAVPVLKSDFAGPPRGTLIMGRFLDKTLVNRIAEQTQVKFSLTGISDAPPCIHPATDSQNGFQIHTVSDDLLHTHAVFPDISGKPTVAIQTVFAREISRKGKNTLRNSILLILAAGAGILVLISLSLKREILTPLSILNEHVLIIKKSGDLSRRLMLFRKDEIGTLARECDNMVARLEKTAYENEAITIQLRKDIEKRKQTEAALAESEKQFRTMIDQAGDAVFLYDATGKIRLVNQAACHRLGYDRRVLLNMTIQEIEPPADAPGQISEARDQQKNFQTAEIMEAWHQRRDKTQIPVEVSRTCIQYGGESLTLSIARDLTERKLMDDQIRKSRKMAAMTTLTAGIAHNFNNLLSIIMGSAELALVKLPEDHPAAALIQRIQRAGERGRDNMMQLIRFSPIGEQENRPIDAATEIEAKIAQLQTTIPTDDIKIIRHLDPRCRPLLNDPEELRIIVDNLLTNAMESFNDGRGVIEVVLECFMAGEIPRMGNHPPDKTFVRLIVRDNGRGIDPGHLDLIFDPYFTTKNFASGAGMGLSVVHGIVAGNGGTVTADSKPGRGTEITIIFPAAETTGEKIDPPNNNP